MAAPIQRISRLASKTFSRLNSSEGFQVHQDRLSQLKSTFNEMTAADVNFDADVIRERDKMSPGKAPVSYIHLWEDECFSMGIFVVKHGGRLPLHDHPGMFGLLKVIHGTLNIASFSEVEGVDVPEEISRRLHRWQIPMIKAVKLESEGTLTADQDCCQLTPSRGNLHEITAVTDVAAFMDILAPPYDQAGSRDCHYYREMPIPRVPGTSGKSKDHTRDTDIRWLVSVPQPTDFWCDSLDYTGPPINPRETPV